MRYFIAYKDVNGKDFNGLPWVMPEGGFNNIQIAQNAKNDFIECGFKDVTLFACDETPEEIDWDFVNANLVIE